MSTTDQIHARLAQHGWAMTWNMPEGHYFYQRGDHWIELEPDGTAFFGIESLRMTNGTHESIVKRFGETPDPGSPQWTRMQEDAESQDALRGLMEHLDNYFSQHWGKDADDLHRAYLRMRRAIENGG